MATTDMYCETCGTELLPTINKRTGLPSGWAGGKRFCDADCRAGILPPHDAKPRPCQCGRPLLTAERDCVKCGLPRQSERPEAA